MPACPQAAEEEAARGSSPGTKMRGPVALHGRGAVCAPSRSLCGLRPLTRVPCYLAVS